MAELIFIWLIALINWSESGKPSFKAILYPKRLDAAMNKVQSEGIGGA